jgi:predicted DNA binding CopG/RHH family protein
MDKQDTKIDVRLPRELAWAAKRKARQQDRPLSQVIRELLRTWIADKPPTPAVK